MYLAYKNAKNSFTIPGLGKPALVNRKARIGQQSGHRRGDQDSRQACGEVSSGQGSQRRHPGRQVISRRSLCGKPDRQRLALEG